MAPRRLSVRDFDPEVMRLFDRYVHGQIDRRAFIAGAARIAAGSAAAAALLDALNPRFAEARQVEPDDARLVARRVEFPSPAGHGNAGGYLVRPAGAHAALPLLLVVHENRGLNPHIEDVARRLALEGYIAFAPDALHPLGGYPGGEDAARTLFRELDPDKAFADFHAAVDWLLQQDGGNGRLGAIGFCYGGGIVNRLATLEPRLAAAVPFYGVAPPVADVAAIRAELLVVLAAEDERVNATWPAYEAALRAAGVRYALFQPHGTQHGFNNDTTPRYDATAAADAWRQATALFARVLRAPAAERTPNAQPPSSGGRQNR